MKKSNHFNVAFCIFAVIFIFVGFAFAEDALFVDADGNVGIGTTPSTALDVAGTITTSGHINYSSTGYLYSAGRMHISGGELLYILNQSGVVIGKAWGGTGNLCVDGYTTLKGNVSIGATSAYGYRLYVYGTTASYGWATLSDKKWKKNIKHLDSTLEKISSLEGVSYDWDTETYPEKQFPNKKQIGFIAQDVEKIYPEVVHTDDEGNKAIEYGKLTAVLVEAVKELKEENDQLKERLAQIDKILTSMGPENNN